MRDAACEHAEALEFLGLLELDLQLAAFFVGPLAFGDVQIGADIAGQVALCVHQGRGQAIDPRNPAFRRSLAIFQPPRPACRDRLFPSRRNRGPVIRMHGLQPRIIHGFAKRKAGHVQPFVVHVAAPAPGIGQKYAHRRHCGQLVKTLLTGASRQVHAFAIGDVFKYDGKLAGRRPED